jgi:hypothetical protein
MMKKLSLYSLSSLAILASTVSYAEQMATAPTLEGGITASIGTWYAAPSADDVVYGTSTTVTDPSTGPLDPATTSTEILTIAPDYDFGWEASLGYVFDDTANDVELSYRGLNTTDTASQAGNFKLNNVGPDDEYADGTYDTNLGYELNAFDLMFGQFLDIGQTTQVRFSAGASYVELEQDQKTSFHADDEVVITPDGEDEVFGKDSNEFRGWGPRLAIDARYDFGSGFGIVAGGSVAYYLGELTSNQVAVSATGDTNHGELDSHAVTNLRGNVALDYVFYMEENDLPTAGIEIGYQSDYYDADFAQSTSQGAVLSSVTFSGPYVNLKGVF